jgi:hypothetical protein
MNSEPLNSEFLASRDLYRIELKNNNGRIVILEFMCSAPADLLDATIRNIFHIKENQLYAVSCADKHTGENIYVLTDGQRLSEYVTMGIEMFDVTIHPPVSHLPSGKFYTIFIFAIRCRLFQKYLLFVI